MKLSWQMRVGMAVASVLLIATLDPARAADAVADLPLLADRQLPMVEAMFDRGKRMPCMIDLGAQFNTMPISLGRSVGVEREGAFTDDGAGWTRYTRRVSAKVRLSDATLRKQEFFLRDVLLNSTDGPLSVCILGQPFIREFTVDLDGIAGRLRLFPVKSPAGAVSGTTTEFSKRDGFMVVPVVLDGIQAQAFIDSGAAISELNRRLQDGLKIGEDDPRLGDSQSIVTLHGAVRGSKTVRLDEILIAGQRIASPQAMLQHSDSMLARFFGRGTPAMMVGWDILQHSRFVIDWTGGTYSVSVEQPQPSN